MENQSPLKSYNSLDRYAPYLGILFLLGYWIFGYDGITFSDDVYYILAGKSFWEGTMEVNSYHFSSRWGAYIPSGLFTFLFGLNAQIASAFSFICYILTLLFLIKVLPKSANSILLVIWFCTQVYFLHFLTKVYPDATLVLWVTLVPVASLFRQKSPILSGIILVTSLFAGFLTKETIVFLAPFPVILFFLDLKSRQLNKHFYLSILLTGITLSFAYLGYFWVAFGDPFYRVTSINAGHYISEFTYADKGVWSILERLTITPFRTFVERAYWSWIVFAFPAIYQGIKNRTPKFQEFTWAFLCLLVGFWFMSSTLEFYNPIYLNPRHLIILVPTMAYLCASGWGFWQNSRKWKIGLSSFLVFGSILAVLDSDSKQVLFLLLFIPIIWWIRKNFQVALLAIILLAPGVYSIYYQKQLKQYDHLTSELKKITYNSESQSPILVNNFIDFSKEVLLPMDSLSQQKLFPIESFEKVISQNPPSFTIVLYLYYQHAYPKENEDVARFNIWLESSDYKLSEEQSEKQLCVRKYQKR